MLAKRWLDKFRQDHPYLPVIITEDALAANTPHIDELKRHNCRYILEHKNIKILKQKNIQSILQQFIGHQKQIPPPQSARKMG